MPTPKPGSSKTPAPTPRSRVLIADDNEPNRELLEVYLAELDCEIATAALHPVAAFATETMGEQPPLLRQGLIGVCRHFGQRQAVLPPGHEVAGVRDRHGGCIPAAVDRAGALDLEEFRMQHSPVELED